jgi:hypothetical protein
MKKRMLVAGKFVFLFASLLDPWRCTGMPRHESIFFCWRGLCHAMASLYSGGVPRHASSTKY